MSLSNNIRTRPGTPYPLGATWDGQGVNFAIFSQHAIGVKLCLFDTVDSEKESVIIRLTERTNMIWHIYLPDARPGWLYGYRVAGPYEPDSGHRFNPAKLLIDPYAKEVARTIRWDNAMSAYSVGNPSEDLVPDIQDNAAYASLCKVVDSTYEWGNDRPLRHPWHETIIYETHVKGLTALHPEVPKPLQGTYAGLVTEPILEHLVSLGITAVELMPIHHHMDDRVLVERKLTNYWGYSTLSFLAPDLRYCSGTMDPVQEFKMMVRTLHSAGIEVILDVVYNHTGEGSHLGPILSLRGIDNKSYYRLDPHSLRHYIDYTGCGNTLNMQEPHVLQLIMDSLRYWILEMHVDGFRFDLASALARELHDVDRLGAFFDIIHQDPVISQVKLIAEPWDLGEGGYQVGNFPVLWTEWNGKYRDTIRRFWKGEWHQLPELATRLAGSSDLYESGGRRPHASINFVTCHDGFTLHDLVSYNDKHNFENGEDNRDGTNANDSWNCGVEGHTENPEIITLRERQKRNLMATLLLSQGVPMICGGDELGRSQGGNNNTYCQDNEISWYRWDLNPQEQAFFNFTQQLIKIRKNPVLRRRKFLQGKKTNASKMKDIAWFSPKGHEMADGDWHHEAVRCLGLRLSGDAIEETDLLGRQIVGKTLLILMNADAKNISFILPGHGGNGHWDLILKTDQSHPERKKKVFSGGASYSLESHSLVVFECHQEKRLLEG